ncbi:cytochrome P450 [Actinomadura viridis]|uniref:cytochrome P450 n=1 Tax=Actinomadura viridis TaxID=58110 RepID=UPI00368CA2AB
MTAETPIPPVPSRRERPRDRIPMYGEEFAADPHRLYDEMRLHGPVAPVELSPGVEATLVVGYDAALEVLRDPGTFPKDPSRWQKTVPAECPVLPMMEARPNALLTDGEVHARLRSAVKDGLARVDSIALREYVENSADRLLDEFAGATEADLVGQYARALPLLVFLQMFGCPPEIGDRLVYGMTGIFDGRNPEEANAVLIQSIFELVKLKRERPAADVTSWMMAHPVRLSDEEMAHQLILLMGAGTEPQQNLIANGLRLLLSDDRFAGDLSGGSLPVEDALDEILWTDPPMANYGITYPTRDVDFAGHRLPADKPVVISFSAANNDPSRATAARTGNRAHLAWSAGPHTCPAKGHARLIASVAIEKLLDRLPEMELAVPVEELRWRPGPFHRALEALPVRFPQAR